MSGVFVRQPGAANDYCRVELGAAHEPLARALGAARLVSLQHRRLTAAAVVAPPGAAAFVNGQRILGGLQLLEHRDELLIAGNRLHFTDESPPLVSLYRPEPGARPLKCALCAKPLVAEGDGGADGCSVVACPRCGRLFHMADERRCWTFRPKCVCGHYTDLEAKGAWMPETEE
jgi:hypothetical protein